MTEKSKMLKDYEVINNTNNFVLRYVVILILHKKLQGNTNNSKWKQSKIEI